MLLAWARRAMLPPLRLTSSNCCTVPLVALLAMSGFAPAVTNMLSACARRLITGLVGPPAVAIAKTCSAGVPEASAPRAGSVTWESVLPGFSATVSEKTSAVLWSAA